MPLTPPEFLKHLDSALRAESSELQLEAFARCSASLLDGIRGPDPAHATTSLETLLRQSGLDVRRHRSAQFCASLIFDKVNVPTTGDNPELLWLFAIPFLVTFPAAALNGPVTFQNNALDIDAILQAVGHSKVLQSSGQLMASSHLYKREDLQTLGPLTLSTQFREASLTGTDLPAPLPLRLDPELDAYRTVCMFVLAGIRVPAGTSVLFNTNAIWPKDAMEAIMRSSLAAQRIEVEAITSLPAQSLAGLHFRHKGPAAAELEQNLVHAKEAYGVHKVMVNFHISGYAELQGYLSDGSLVMLVPPFSFFEPELSLLSFVNKTCAKLGLQYGGPSLSFMRLSSSAVH